MDSPADELYRPGEQPSGIRVEADLHSLAGLEIFEAVLAVVGHHPPLTALNTCHDRRANMDIRPYTQLDIGHVSVDRRIHLRPAQVEFGIGELRLDFGH